MQKYRGAVKAVGLGLLVLSWGVVAMPQLAKAELSEREAALAEFSIKEDELAIKNPKFYTQFDVRVTQARVQFEESGTLKDSESSWDAWLTRGDLMLSIYNDRGSKNDIGIEVGFGVFRTTSEEENFDLDFSTEIDGNTVTLSDQENDMDFNGWELKAGIGCIHDFEGPWKLKNLLYYGRRVIEFDRTNIDLTDINNVTFEGDTVQDDEFTIDYIGYSPHITAEWEDGWSFSFKPGFAYVVNSEAQLDAFNSTIDGEGGFIASTEAQMGYSFNENISAYIGILGEWQYLEGDTEEGAGNESFEWSDNDLYTYGLMVGLMLNL
jgi:hypothetical protein